MLLLLPQRAQRAQSRSGPLASLTAIFVLQPNAVPLPMYRKMEQRMSDSLTKQIIGAAIEVHRHLGPGLLESIYEEALCVELQLRSIQFQRQVEIDVIYKRQVIKGQRLDLLVANEVVIEIKAVSRIPEVATAQILSYLKATGLRRGMLLNFGVPRLVDGIKRVAL
jgi:GxxExxY protein